MATTSALRRYKQPNQSLGRKPSVHSYHMAGLTLAGLNIPRDADVNRIRLVSNLRVRCLKTAVVTVSWPKLALKKILTDFLKNDHVHQQQLWPRPTFADQKASWNGALIDETRDFIVYICNGSQMEEAHWSCFNSSIQIFVEVSWFGRCYHSLQTSKLKQELYNNL